MRTLLVTLILLLQLASSAYAVDKTPALKVAYMYYFSKFVNWPEESFSFTRNINLCIGDASEEIKFQLSTIDKKRVGVKRLNIIYLEKPKEAGEHEYLISTGENSCHLLYINQNMEYWYQSNEERLPGYTLTISDDAKINNSVITLHKLENRVTFEIDSALAEEKELKISSKLLKLSRKRGGQ